MTPEATPTLVRSLLDAIPDALLVVDQGGRITLVNHQAEVMFGYARDELLGQSVEQLIPDELRSLHLAHRSGFAEAPRLRAMGVAQKLSGRRRNGTLLPVEVALSPTQLENGNSVTIATVRDVTERLAADEALAEARHQSMLLADRERVARDLHDTVIQELFATGMHLQATLPMLEDEATSRRLSDAVDAIDDTIKHVRETIFGLTSNRSAHLRERIEEVVRSFDGVLAHPATLTLSGDVSTISDAIVEHLVPTLREALSNVAKHARADSTRVVVAVGDGTLQLEVRDNGVGVDEEAVAARSGHGVSNLTDRAAALGGEFRLSREPAGGSVLSWRVPIS
jgi:PAS domain S-box-containing protein